ncbi:MAG: hypothetical protein QXF37_02810 [Archaeoglobaceae archaeon]
MSYKIKATPEFEKALKDLTKKNSELALRIAKAIKKLSENPNAGNRYLRLFWLKVFEDRKIPSYLSNCGREEGDSSDRFGA